MARYALPCNFNDLEIMARTVFGEAGGEEYLGKIAVAWCIRTRAELDLGNDAKPDWWGEGITGVCQKPYQFSCWLPSEKVYLSMIAAGVDRLGDCLKACFGVLLGESPDPTGGATHYLNPASLPGGLPSWARGKPPTAIIGRHHFFRLI